MPGELQAAKLNRGKARQVSSLSNDLRRWTAPAGKPRRVSTSREAMPAGFPNEGAKVFVSPLQHVEMWNVFRTTLNAPRGSASPGRPWRAVQGHKEKPS
jgi:hypothetical protein